jgi:D-glycero-alpha-D-manno-heptose 1-phosphate guanylyltransferase
MQAVILLGGRGTRIASLYPDRPKALVPVAGRPFIEWQIDWLRRGGATSFHLAAGHLADQIEAWAAPHPDITVSREPEPLGTGGALRHIEPHLHHDRFWVLNGDTLLPNLDFQRLENRLENFPTIGKTPEKSSNDWKNTPKIFQRLENHPEKSSNDWKIALAVVPIAAAGRFGTVEFDDAGRITAFREKAERAAGWINGGIYAMSRAALAEVPAGRFCSLETDLFPRWVAEQRLLACPADAPLLDMGTPEGLAEMGEWLTAQ